MNLPCWNCGIDMDFIKFNKCPDCGAAPYESPYMSGDDEARARNFVPFTPPLANMPINSGEISEGGVHVYTHTIEHQGIRINMDALPTSTNMEDIIRQYTQTGVYGIGVDPYITPSDDYRTFTIIGPDRVPSLGDVMAHEEAENLFEDNDEREDDEEDSENDEGYYIE